jgi:hypothetical protein
MSSRVNPVAVDTAIDISGMTDRQMRAAGYDYPEATREAALEALATEVVRLRRRLYDQKLAGSAWAKLVAETKETP